ncbi:MAG: SpoIIE family protein phosphatase [Deltaproteobacteria bacterium]|nr:SpoIIE family protein phosphatase [Deltaproteobacteria bacterium]
MRLPLRAFLFASLAGAVLAPLAYLGISQTLRWREVHRQEVDRELTVSAESLARTIGRAIGSDVRQMTALANSIALQDLRDRERIEAMLRNHCTASPSCMAVTVTDVHGEPRMASHPLEGATNLGKRDYYQAMLATGRTAISGVQMGWTFFRPTIHIAAPIWKTDPNGSPRFAGAVITATGLSYLQDLATRTVEPFGDMHAEILDDQRRVVISSSPLGTLSLTDRSRSPMYSPGASQQTTLRDGRDDAGEPVRVALAPFAVEGRTWMVVVMRPTKTVNEQTDRSLRHTLFVTLGALLLGLLLALVLSWLLARPIVRLTRFATGVAKDGPQPKPAAAPLDARETTELAETVFSMVAKLQDQTRALREREQEQIELAKIRQEMDIAARIQSGILPRHFEVPGFEFAARMQPADEIGGDYYEILPTESGFWIAAGDVSGHGLTAGLVMLMLQSALGALALYAPREQPSRILRATNALLVENIRRRLRGDDHVTLVLLHVDREGRFVFAGGHEPLLILRDGSDTCEVINTPGPWIGIMPELGKELRDGSGQLQAGDLLILHSDGVVQAGALQHRPFGLDRLRACIEESRGQPLDLLRDEILRRASDWSKGEQDDDMMVLLVRRSIRGKT